MGLRGRYVVAEHDGTVTRVARSRYQRWLSKDEALPANRVGSELRFLEVVVEMDHHRVEDVLHILPFRHWVRGDGTLDAGAAMQLAVKRFDLLGPGFGADAQALIEQLEADANYFWLPGGVQTGERAERRVTRTGRSNGPPLPVAVRPHECRGGSRFW